MATLTLDFNDKELKILNDYMEANKISLKDLPKLITSFLTIEKYNDETIKAIEEVENNIGLSKVFTSIKDLKDDLNA